MTTENTKFTCKIQPTNNSIPLGLRVMLDQVIIFENAHVTKPLQVQYFIPDEDGEHELTFELYGKKSEHTKIDTLGSIISDAMLSISEMEIDEINIDQIVQSTQSKVVYCHDFNGTQSSIEDVFHGYMGCNGTVTLKFTTPIYLWLLEHM